MSLLGEGVFSFDIPYETTQKLSIIGFTVNYEETQ
jgi:hypothetical protein